MKRLSAFLDSINTIETTGDGDPMVAGITYDSRRVEEGSLFVALPGIHVDGHDYLQNAVSRGASALVVSRPVHADFGVPVIRVDDSRRALSSLSAAFFNHPSKSLVVIGVTGTDGKSTTVSFIHQLLRFCGRRSGFLSTVEFAIGDTVEKNVYRQSTPESSEIQEILAKMRYSGLEYAVVESTSHGLSERTGRLRDVYFDAAVFTNVTHEHLEFHGSVEQYRNDKANLFRALDRTAAAAQDSSFSGRKQSLGARFGIVNRDDPHWKLFADATSSPVLTYAIDQRDADLTCEIRSGGFEGSELVYRYMGERFATRLPLPARFNIENACAAILSVSVALGVHPSEVAEHLPKLRPVKGRMHSVKKGQPFSVIVDYAHTPGAFMKFFPIARSYTRGRLIAVFGSGGERDIEKRPIQGKIASEFCDVIILSDEDPRLEDREKILREIASGVPSAEGSPELHIIPDRYEAIEKACSLARGNDTVVLLGKGHEASIITRDGPMSWDEASVAESILESMGFSSEPG